MGDDIYFKVGIPFTATEDAFLAKNKVSYNSDDVSVEFYPKRPEMTNEEDINGNKYETTINEDGGIEFDTILHKKPISNKIIFPIDSKGLEFYYQPGLNEEDQNKEFRCTETTCWNDKGRVVSFRPEHIGSIGRFSTIACRRSMSLLSRTRMVG